MWARFLVELLPQLPGVELRRAVDVLGPLRMVKDAAEVEALRAAGAAADRVARQLHAGEIPLVGRTEAQVSADISARLLEEGHDKVNFAIVAAGENAASPHHHAGATADHRGRDRAVRLRRHDGRLLQRHDALRVHRARRRRRSPRRTRCCTQAQQASVAAATVGTPCEEVDRAARAIIAAAGYGEQFVHRTGHGIGMEEHEDPYIVEGNTRRLEPGHAFSVEPGIYVAGRWGMRLEDIVVATALGPERAQQLRSLARVGLTARTVVWNRPVRVVAKRQNGVQLSRAKRASSTAGWKPVIVTTTSAASSRASGPLSSAQ